MPWKTFKSSFLQRPNRQEVMIILVILAVAALVIGFYVLRS
ncbi:hypothetical protein CEB3_c31700 [Peptococcaceae bacterium CEB3]|nr:hypothetical protein CEB3_c31700 [Peptococcaceae bacterium CEB3]